MIKCYCIYDRRTGDVLGEYTGEEEGLFLEGNEGALEITEGDADDKVVDLNSGRLVDPVPTLDEEKAELWRQMKEARNQAEFGTFTYLGFTFDIDQLSQQRIQGAVQMATLDPDLITDWTLADNTTTTLSASELVGLGVALGQHVSSVHAYARALRAQIQATNYVSDLASIKWRLE